MRVSDGGWHSGHGAPGCCLVILSVPVHGMRRRLEFDVIISLFILAQLGWQMTEELLVSPPLSALGIAVVRES